MSCRTDALVCDLVRGSGEKFESTFCVIVSYEDITSGIQTMHAYLNS